MSLRKNRGNKGLTLVEAVIGAAIIAFVLAAVVTAYNRYIKASINAVPTVQASYLLDEGIEVSKILRDTSWSGDIATLTPDTPYYLVYDDTSSTWSLSTAPSLVDNFFTRTLTVSDVERDSDSNIVASGGTVDPNTKEVTMTVTWQTSATPSTEQVSAYITNLFDN